MLPLLTKVEIPHSKWKLLVVFIGSLVFIVIGLIFVIQPYFIKKEIYGMSFIIMAIGFMSIIFFGICGYYIVQKLLDTKPGFTIDQYGIIDNSSGTACGRILWSDINNLSVIKINSQRLIMLHISNAQDFIDRQKSPFKRKMMKLSCYMYGSPLSISSNGLEICFDDLLKVITVHYTLNKSKS